LITDTTEKSSEFFGLSKMSRNNLDTIDRIIKLKAKLAAAVKVLEMVQDNTKMPHSHSDPQLRLYCLAERASEVLKELNE